jgi:endonuclease YncB( thermonuclease family)
MAHDFKKQPELLNSQMQIYYLQSPHKQITEDFSARVVEVHDGDTISLDWEQRDFVFPIRFANVAAPELNEDGGHEAQEWLENRLLGKTVDIKINPNNRVGKFGRLIGNIMQGGQDVGEEEIFHGLVTSFKAKNEGKIIDPVKRLK